MRASHVSCEHRHDRSHRAHASWTSRPRRAETSVSKPPADRLLAGNPEQTARNYFSDSSGRFFAGVWESTPGRWRVRYTENEFCHLTRGRVRIEDACGRQWTLQGRRFLRHSRRLRGHVGSARADRQALRDLRSRCFLVRSPVAFAPKWGVNCTRFGRCHGHSCGGSARLACLLHFRLRRLQLTARLGVLSHRKTRGASCEM